MIGSTQYMYWRLRILILETYYIARRLVGRSGASREAPGNAKEHQADTIGSTGVYIIFIIYIYILTLYMKMYVYINIPFSHNRTVYYRGKICCYCVAIGLEKYIL